MKATVFHRANIRKCSSYSATELMDLTGSRRLYKLVTYTITAILD